MSLAHTIRTTLNLRVRPSLWALRTRRDGSVLSAAMRGPWGWRYKAASNREHLAEAMGWLVAAQDATPDDGVSAFYDIRTGDWCPSYPETTGYIIPTFYDYAALTGDDSYRERAERMAEWLLSLQLTNGAFPIGPLWPDWDPDPIVFDTGQIILGLARAFEETDDQRYLEAIQRAGDWLAEVQAPDGSWRKHVSLNYVHVYNARVAWALLRVYELSGEESYRVTAVDNLNWTLTQQNTDGWFRNASFRPEEAPLTHTIVYTIRGLWESGQLLNDERYTQAARLASDAIRRKQAEDGFIRACYNPGWRSDLRWTCLTGNAQMAIMWLKLYEQMEDDAYLRAAQETNHYLKQTQPRNNKCAGVSGGISGSFPAYEVYEPYRHLNWAVKFFADALILEEQL